MIPLTKKSTDFTRADGRRKFAVFVSNVPFQTAKTDVDCGAHPHTARIVQVG